MIHSIVEAAGALRSRSVSSVELTQTCLRRIERLQPALNAFLAVTSERALTVAAERDKELASGTDRGPLHGIPVALKDLFDVQGLITTGGTKLRRDHIAAEDSDVWKRLAGAGAVLLGKTGLHEFAYGITSNNPHFGPVRNPWDTDRIPGGSSGGSGAAVATNMCLMAMGTDTGGSIRIPAAYCGTVGFKPSFERVSRRGVLPLGFTLDHMGPLTRTVEDAALVTRIIAGDAEQPALASLEGKRLGVPTNFYFDRVDARVAKYVHDLAGLAARSGALIVPVQVPDIPTLNVVARVILLAEASAALEPYWDRRDQFGDDVRSLIDQGRLVAGTDYVQAQRLRSVFRQQFQELFEKVDVLLTPSAPIVAPRIGQTSVEIEGEAEDSRLASTRFMRGINPIGLPALALPCGLVDNLPVSAQLVGAFGSDYEVLAIGRLLEQALGLGLTPPCTVA